MAYILLFITVLLSVSETLFGKQYNVKAKNQNLLMFSGMCSLAAMVFFVISSGFRLEFNPWYIPYSLGFAAAYGCASIGVIYAIRTGPLAITSLIISYSLLVPTLYGIIFLHEKMHILSYFGIALLLISLFLINMKKEDTKFSPVWIVFIILSFVGNGMCSTVQKMQQLRFDGAYKSEFMIVALAAVTVVLFVIAMLQKGDKKQMIKECLIMAPARGIANGAVNLLVMIMTGKLANAIVFPSISAGSIVITFVVAWLLYRERFTKIQLIGYAAGVISVILLNI